MNRELARKLPAVVVDARPIETRETAGTFIVRCASRGQLAAAVTAHYRAGRIERAYRVGRQGDMWVAEVIKRPPLTWWSKHRVKVIFAGVVLAGILAFLYLLVQVLVAFWPYLVVFALIMLGGSILAGRDIVEVWVKVAVRR